MKLTVRTDRLCLVKCGHEVIAKNESVVDELLKLQKIVTDKQDAWTVVEETFAPVKESVGACGELNAKLPESDKLLKAADVEVVSVKKEASRASAVKKWSNKAILEAREKFERCLLRLKFALVNQSHAEKLTL